MTFKDVRLFGRREVEVNPKQSPRLVVARDAPADAHFFDVVLSQSGPPIETTGNPCIIVDGGPD